MDKQHTLILVLFLLLFILISAVFIYIFRTSVRAGSVSPEQQGTGGVNQKRLLLGIILGAILTILVSVTLQKTPYYFFADEEPSKVVFVAVRQFSFSLSSSAIDPQTTPAPETISIHTGETVEFRVTSFDVNHGFAIYDAQDQLIAQTQAMPGYVNRLRWQFDRPGNYKILCLEFCGMAHAFMSSSFSVH